MNKRDFHVPTSPVPRIEDILHAHESRTEVIYLFN